MTQPRRFRVALRWVAPIAILTVASMLAWCPLPPDHVSQRIVLYCGTAIILLWSVTDATRFFSETVEQMRLHRRAMGAVPARLLRVFSGKSQFGTFGGRTRSAGDVSVNIEPAPLPPFVGKTVLIADDDFDITQMLVMKFERLGMTALRTPDALQLLFGVHHVKPDLVVLDVKMPTGNGLALCEMLNSDEDHVHPPVIIYTGCSAESTVRRCQSLGAHYVLKAPNSWTTIEEIVYRLISPCEVTLRTDRTCPKQIIRKPV